MASRNPLGIALSDSLGIKPLSSFVADNRPIVPDMNAGFGITTPDANIPDLKKPGFLAPGSKGAMIAGIIGDMLSTASGGQAQFMPMQMQERQRQQQKAAEEAQWSRRRMADREDKQWEWRNKPRDPSPMERDANAWLHMTPEQQAAYRQAQMVRPQFIPDGMGGGQWASPAASPAQQPAIGAVMPDPRKAGGPQATPAVPFRR